MRFVVCLFKYALLLASARSAMYKGSKHRNVLQRPLILLVVLLFLVLLVLFLFQRISRALAHKIQLQNATIHTQTFYL